MAENETYDGYQYKLRAGSPMPIGSTGGGGYNFMLFTFGAEIYRITVETATTSIVSSTEFRGQGGDLIRADYSRLSDRSGGIFQGKLTYSPTFVDEDAIP